jgi:4'-phosphopantetheinyl transferase
MMPVWGEPPLEPLLAQGHVDVWHWDFHRIRDFAPSDACLSQDEHAHSARFKTEESGRNFIGSHIFLRRVLSLYLKVDPSLIVFETDALNRPHLPGFGHTAGVQFNLSHSSQSAVCAVACDIRVGIDLERVSPQLCDESTAQLVFTETELEGLRRLRPSEQPAAFFRGWTRKEAYGKCIGLGLSESLRDVELGLTEPILTFRGVEVRTFYCPNGYIGSLAAAPPPHELRFFNCDGSSVG